MNLRKLPLLLLLMLAICACKEPDNGLVFTPTPVYNYFVNYYKTSDSTDIRFNYSVSNNLQFLPQGDRISANNQPLVPDSQFMNYNLKLKGLQDVTFTITKSSGKQINNTARLIDVGDINFPSTLPGSISRSAGIQFSWTGPALLAGQTVSIMVAGPKPNGKKFIHIKGLGTGSLVTLDNSFLKDFDTGHIELSLIRNVFTSRIKNDTNTGGLLYLNLQADTTVRLVQ